MDIIRIFKLKKLAGELNNLTPEEVQFFKLHDNLHYDKYGWLCDANSIPYIFYNTTNKIVSYNLIFSASLNINIDCDILISNILDKYLNLNNLEIRKTYIDFSLFNTKKLHTVTQIKKYKK